MQVRGGCCFKFQEVFITVTVIVQPFLCHRSPRYLPTLQCKQYRLVISVPCLRSSLPPWRLLCRPIHSACVSQARWSPPALSGTTMGRQGRGCDPSAVGPLVQFSLWRKSRNWRPVQKRKMGKHWLCPVWSVQKRAEHTQGWRGCWYRSKLPWSHGFWKIFPADGAQEGKKAALEPQYWTETAFRAPFQRLFWKEEFMQIDLITQVSAHKQLKCGKKKGKILRSTYMTWQSSFQR